MKGITVTGIACRRFGRVAISQTID